MVIMWSESIEILNPYEATRESIERELAEKAYRDSLPILYKSSVFTRVRSFLRTCKLRRNYL